MNKETILEYNAPAEDFNSALPVGNGRIGGMIFGGAASELIRLNEDSFWSGSLRHRINPDAKEGLEEVRALLKDGNIPDAEKIAFEKMQGVTPEMRRYLPLGDLRLHMDLGGKAKEYRRSLDLENACAEISFSVNGLNIVRSVFVSAPDNVMAVKISADSPASINLECFIEGRDDNYDDNRPCGKNMLLYTGGNSGISFAAVLGAAAEGGTLRTLGGKICVKNADEVMLILSV